MTTTRGEWIRFLLAGLSIAAAPFGLSTARAQGFGPDPFRPYNSQYEPYVRPLSDPGLAAGAAASARGGRGDNQFQDYLNQLEGAERASSQRYGIGVPYWRARTDAERDRRESKANRRTDRSPEATLESINQKYLAYFSESDPRKRAVLLRDFSSTRQSGAREPLRREAGADDRDTAADPDSERRPRLRAGSDDVRSTRTTKGRSGEEGRFGALSSSRRSTGASAESDSRTIPPPPPLRRGSRGSTIRKERTPSDTLDRSLGSGDSDPGPAPALRRRGPVRPSPAPADE